MVCVPCFIIPLLLFIWHKFIQPYVLRFWNPWAVKDADGNVVKTEFPFACEGGVCAFKRKNVQKDTDGGDSLKETEPSSGDSLKETSQESSPLCPGKSKAE